MPLVCVCVPYAYLSIYLSIYTYIHTYSIYIYIPALIHGHANIILPDHGLPSSYPIFTAFPSEVHSSRGIDPRGQSYLDRLLVSTPWKTSIFVKSSSQIRRKMVSTLETANHWIELVDPNNLWEKLSCLIWSANDSEMIAQSKYFER